MFNNSTGETIAKEVNQVECIVRHLRQHSSYDKAEEACSMYTDIPEFGTGITVVFWLAGLVIIISNAAVLWGIIRRPELRKQLHILKANLAVVDMLAGIGLLVRTNEGVASFEAFLFSARCGIWFSMGEGGESFEAKMQRAMEVNNRAILNAVSTMMDQKFSDQKRSNEESAEAQLSEIKKLKTTKPTFERKGNEEQYKFYLQATSGRASGRGEGSGEAGKVQKGVEELEKARKLFRLRRGQSLDGFVSQTADSYVGA
ncbi:Gamma-tubulin complex component 5 [Branchiostoma belcheri]|nr:Gamma-tubulin complex component 5 [Branchiostoma belcheri]